MDSRQEIENKINNLKGDDRVYANNYFLKRSLLDSLFDKVRSKLKVDSFGNANAKVVFVLDFKRTSDKPIWIIKEFFNKNGFSPYNAYFTQINKTESNELNLAILQKELDIISPNRVVIINYDDIDVKVKDKRFLHVDILDRLINRKELNLPQQEVKDILSNIAKIMEYAIIGR